MKKLFVFLMLGLFMISFASAAEWDNVKSYDSTTREVTITNALGLGAEIGKARLNTPLNVKVATGYQKVAEFDLWAYQDYNDALKAFTFEDMKNGRQKINRDYDLKYRSYEDIEVIDYKNDCSVMTEWGCSVVEDGSHIEQREVWTKVTPANLKKNEVLTIGVFTDVRKGDYVDWIPMIYGIEVEEWATWEETLNADLISGWNLDGSTTAVDLLGANDLTNTGVTTGEDGIINKSYLFDTSTDVLRKTQPVGLSGSDYSFSMWINLTGADSDDTIWNLKQPSPNRNAQVAFEASSTQIRWAFYDGTSRQGSQVTYTSYFNNWTHLAGTYDGARAILYLNGNVVANDSIATSDFAITATSTLNYGNLNPDLTTRAINGNMDEAYYWDRAITHSDVINLFGGGNPPYLNETGDLFPNITLNSPASSNYTTVQSHNINFTASDRENLSDVKLYINGVLNATNATGVNNSDYIFPVSLGDGNYTIWGVATDNFTQTTNSSSIVIFVDATLPSINATAPSGTLTDVIPGQNTSLNVTFTDANLESCWYNYNGTNVTIDGCLTGVKNSTLFLLESGNTNMTIYANDTLGNLNSSFISWDMLIEHFIVSYDSNITEGELDVFTLNTSIGGGNTITQAIFEYNGTNYTTSIGFSGGEYSIGSSITAPLVSADTNVTFRFYIVINGVTYSPSFNNQTILNLNFGTCGVESSDVLLTMWLLDEVARTSMQGDIEINADLISKTSGETIATLNNTFSNVTNGSICFDPVSSYPLYYLDSEIRYEATDYAAEFYFIQKADLANYPANLSLFDLELNSSTEFLIKYQDDNLITVEGAIIQLLRKYVGADTYETVEAPLTSNIGTAVAHVDLNTNLYQAIVVKDGVVLDTFTNIVFDCENELSGQCTENLFGQVDPQNSADVEVLNDFVVAVSSINETITTTFSIPSGTPSTVNIVLRQVDSFGDEYLCNQTIISSAGSIDCSYNKTIGDSRVYLTIMKDNVIYVNKGYFIAEDLDLGFAGNNYIIVLLLLLTLVGMAFASPEWIVIIGIVAFVIAGGLWLINGMSIVMGLGLLIFVIAAAAILIKEMTKQEDQ